MKKKKDNKRKVRDEENFVPKAFLKDKELNNLNDSFDEEEKIRPRRKNKKGGNKKILQDGKLAFLKNLNLKKVILIMIIILVIIFAIWLAVWTNTWKSIVTDMVKFENSSVIDTDNNEIAKLGSERKNITVSLSEIPDNLKNAYIAIEDERYYSHGGIDVKRTVSAIGSYIIHFGKSSYGGSTITQQLVKNLTGDDESGIDRKIREWWEASQLETCLSKDEILEAYLNVIYVGPNMYGTATGAKYYFNKDISDLSLAECSFLAGINNSPNSYNPFDDSDNSEKIKTRAKTVLSKMLELKYINQDAYNSAVAEIDNGLKFKKGTIDSSDGVYSYHTDALINEITTDIAEKYNISEKFATNYINMAGLTIKSTQDSSVQKEIETESKKKKYILASKKSSDTSQAAMVIIDHTTGHVVGCTGGLGEKTTARSLNRATQSIRQTGSAIKPLSVLAPAIDKKIITAASMYDDTEKDFADGYHPTDYNSPLGNITVRRAVESSQNIPFVEIMEKLKPSTAISYMKKMGITTLTEEDNSLVLALGGLQEGISPLQMAGAYATIANDGQYIEPVFYSDILNSDSKSICKPTQEKRQVFSKEVAYILKEILTQPVLGEHGTATYCKISGIDVVAKTGTTDENYDRWLCGFTPYYTAVTWFGYDQNESIEYNNRNPAGLIWANVMSRIHTGLASKEFEQPYAITPATICADTGELARTGCTNTYIEYFLWFTKPGLCSKHSGDESKLDDSGDDVTNKIQDVFQGITDEIDINDVPSEIQNVTVNNTNTTNTTNTTNSVNNHNSSNIVTNQIMQNNVTNTTNSTSTNHIRNETNTNTNQNNTTNTTDDLDQTVNVVNTLN